jgi:hypothetical protein
LKHSLSLPWLLFFPQIHLQIRLENQYVANSANLLTESPKHPLSQPVLLHLLLIDRYATKGKPKQHVLQLLLTFVTAFPRFTAQVSFGDARGGLASSRRANLMKVPP